MRSFAHGDHGRGRSHLLPHLLLARARTHVTRALLAALDLRVNRMGHNWSVDQLARYKSRIEVEKVF